LNSIPTPCYLVDEKALGKNLEIIKKLKQETNCQVILALKGFSTFATFPQLKLFLDGVTASSIYEARLGLEEFNNEVHVHSIGMNKEECHQFNTIGTKISFNSIAQFEQFKNHVTQINPSLGLRINPQLGTAPTEKYDPCAPHSRLGIPIELFSSDYFNQIEGLHFHALCEQNANSLIKILEKIELKFGNNLHKLKWMNWGGGHLITSHEYDLELLIKTINYWQKKYDLQVILEPGDAIARNTVYY
ncbi:MAG: carboxynorspermidine decarboxylase, partial [Candidatus Margulisiibacteriota bacterium]